MKVIFAVKSLNIDNVVRNLERDCTDNIFSCVFMGWQNDVHSCHVTWTSLIWEQNWIMMALLLSFLFKKGSFT